MIEIVIYNFILVHFNIFVGSEIVKPEQKGKIVTNEWMEQL